MKSPKKKTLRQFISDFATRYLAVGVAVDQKFLPRIAEGEVRVICCAKRIIGIVHKIPLPGQIAATQNMGAKYDWYEFDGVKHRFSPLNGAPPAVPAWRWLAHRLERELIGESTASLFDALGVEPDKLPVVWTVDFILANDNQYYVGEFNCSCPGVFYRRPQCFTEGLADSVLEMTTQGAAPSLKQGLRRVQSG